VSELLEVEGEDTVVVVREVDSALIVEENVSIVEVTAPGPQGGKGVKGDKGDQGDEGVQGDPGVDSTVPGPQGPPGPTFAYIHAQSIPLATWVINHNLNGYPNVATVDTNSPPEEIEGEVKWISPNVVHVVFAFATGGQAFLS
jgi:hypothetical protein